MFSKNILFLWMILFGGCTLKKNESQVKYGHLASQSGSFPPFHEDENSLLTALPESTICVSADIYGDLVKRAILEWAAVLSRDNIFSF